MTQAVKKLPRYLRSVPPPAEPAATPRQASVGETAHLAALGALLASVAHELRGPAGALSLLVPQLRATLASMPQAPDVADALVRDMGVCADRILGLCDELRNVTRRDSATETFDLGAMVREVCCVARVHAQEAGLEIGVDVEPIAIHGRRFELSQVVLNLILNAVDACREVPRAAHRVDVRLTIEGLAAVLSVSDTGPGVPAELRDAVFEPFFTTKPRGKGTGLGLSISREIVSSHHGRLELRQRERGGAVFSVVLPLPLDRASHTRLKSVRPAAIPVCRKRILLVDDDSLLLRTMRRSLAAHAVTLAGSVDEAQQAIESAREPFEVIIADLAMPSGGGIRLHEWLVGTGLDAGTRFVFATGGITCQSDADYIARSGCRYLLKPMRPEELQREIAS